MKAISIWQPWASLIETGAKKYETRGWAPPAGVIGTRIAICAAKTTKGIKIACGDRTLRAICNLFLRTGPGHAWFMPDGLPLGAVIATAHVADAIKCPVLESEDPGEGERALGDWSDGRWAWHLTDVRVKLHPIPVRGMQKLFTLPDEITWALP